MGCAESKPALDSVHVTKQTPPTVKTSTPPVSLSERVSEESLKTQLDKQKKKGAKEWAVQPGYSSGADSLGDADSDSGSVGSSGRGGIDRSMHSDILDLSTLRQEMMDVGDLTTTVVRIETPFGKPIEEIYDGVHDGPVLGSGVSGIVRLVTHRATGVKYAVKCLDIGIIDSIEGLRQLRDEIFIMCQLDHPNIVRIEEVYESTNDIFIVQELCHGGDLFDRLDEQPDFHYTEAQCAKLVKQMLSSIRYLHSKGIIHRDLKLENFLFSSSSADSELKMIDFGLSKHFLLGEEHHEKVGTPYTVSPEIIRGTYDEKSDVWSLGVITYLLLSGETPFGGLDGESLLSVKEKIMRAQVSFEPEEVWANVSPQGKAFVKRLLNPDPKMRPTAKGAQLDEWIQVWARKDIKEGAKLNPNIVGALVSFKECSDMQKLLSEVLSFTLLPDQIVELRSEFQKIDKDGTGEISLTAMKSVLMENAEAGSLGGLSELEIEEIFDSIRVRKSNPTIRWHEFLAAGLSQAKVDDRNLRLAFDRLDSDRKGFITFDDMEDLLGGANMDQDDNLEKIWGDSLLECKAHLNRITFQDFKSLMKGQPKDAAASASHVSIGGLAPVPEGKLPEEMKDNIAGPSEVSLNEGSGHDPLQLFLDVIKTRSRSFGSPGDEDGDRSSSSLPDVGTFSKPEIVRDASLAILLPSTAAEDELVETINDSSMSPLVVNRAIYRKHREMRNAVLEASKQFDVDRVKRRKEEYGKAGLIMKRGAMPPGELEDAHQRALFDSAAKRCGRARRTRNKTVSDVTGMLLKAQA